MVVLFAQYFGIRGAAEMDRLLTYDEFCDLEKAALQLARRGSGG